MASILASARVWTLSALFLMALQLWCPEPADAVPPVAVDDNYEAPAGGTLLVEPAGVLENDTDAMGENLPPAAIAALVGDVGDGTLALASDGSFTYTPAGAFLGVDTFMYRVIDGAESSNVATVTLDVTGCTGTLQLLTCWIESEYQAKLAELGFDGIQEGFEDDAVWGDARTPANPSSITSNGITWSANQAGNGISTSMGAAHSGAWGAYSNPHGSQSGGPFDPQRDGVIGAAADTLFGVGGWLRTNTPGARTEFVLSSPSSPPVPVGFADNLLTSAPRFFGVIDTRGFASFEVYETEGVVEDQKLIFVDDFTIGTHVPVGVGESRSLHVFETKSLRNPARGEAGFGLSLSETGLVVVEVFDASGRRVRRVASRSFSEGAHEVTWDGLADDGSAASSGAYFLRVATASGARTTKFVFLR